jgi:hypothetical protein
MKRIERYNEFSKAEQELLHILEQIGEIHVNEGVIGYWLKKLTEWFERINDGIRNLMLVMLEKGMKALDSFKKFFKVVIDKVVTFKEKNPVVFRTIMITLVLLVLFFVLCSAAASTDKRPPVGVINAAIGFLHDINAKGDSNIDNSILLKAQAYLLELKKSGTELNVGEDAVKAANGAIDIIQQDIQEFNKSGGTDQTTANYLMKLAEQGARLVSYKIKEYNDVTGSFKSQDISLGYK